MAIVFQNNARTTLASGINSSATSITVADGSVLPSPTGGDFFFCTFDDGTNSEIVKVTARSGNTLTVIRAQDDTTARSFVTGDLAELRLIKAVLESFPQVGSSINEEVEAYLDANGTTFPDNVKAQFGAGNDLQIFHNGSHSYINDLGDGFLKIGGASQVEITNNTNTEQMAVFKKNGAVELYYDNAQKFATTSTGIDVTGTATMDGLTVDGVAEISSTTPTLRFFETDQTNEGTLLRSAGDSFQIAKMLDSGAADGIRLAVDQSSGDISFYEDTGTTAKFFWDASAESLGIGTTSPSSTASLHLKGAGGTELHMESGDGQSTSIIKHNQSANSLEFTPNSNAGKILDILSTGIDVTGIVTATGGNSTNWNTAYGWGDHGVEGYLTSSSSVVTNKLPLAGGTMTGNINLNSNDLKNINLLQFKNRELTDFDGSMQMILDANDSDSNVPGHGDHANSYPMGIYFTGDDDQSTTTLGNGLVKVWHTGHFTKAHIDYFVGLKDTGVTTTEFDYLDGVTSSIQTQLNGKLTSSSLSGYATESYVGTQISNLVDSSPAALNTLNELAAALGDNENFATDVNANIATKLPLAGGTMTGAINMGSNNLTSVGTISSGAITSSGTITSSQFNNDTHVSNATTPANTAGWFKIAKVVRGAGRILLSFTGGSYTPDTFVIDYYRNWSTAGSLFLKQYMSTSYIDKARIRQDSSDSNYYVEIYCASNSNGLSFQVYHQRLQGFANGGNTVYGDSLSAGATSGTDVVTEQSFISKGTWTEGIEADYYYGHVNIHSGSLKLNNTTVIDSSRNLTNIGTISSGAITSSGDVTTTGHYIADTHFRSSDSNVTLSATGGGGVYLRPDGNSNSTNQAFIASGTGNATFAGTLNANSVVSSSVVTANSAMNIIGATGSSGYMYIYDRDNGTSTTDGFLLQKSGNNAFVYNRKSTGKLFLGAGGTNSYLTIFSNGDYYAGSTKWFDQARNLININSLAIGTASTTLDLDVKKSAGGSVVSRVWNSSTAGTGSAIFRLANSGNNANGSQLQFTDNTYYVGTITADRTNGMRFRVANTSDPIDTSTIRLTINPLGNATFTGTISSGAITSTGNIAINAGNKIQLSGAGDGTHHIYHNSSTDYDIVNYSTGFQLEHTTSGTQFSLVGSTGNATFSGGITTGGVIQQTGNEGREIRTYMPSSYTTNDIVSGHEYGWYNDYWIVGMSRSGAAPGEAFRFNYSGSYVAQIGTTGIFDGTGYRVNNTTVIDSSRNLTNIVNLGLSGSIQGTGNFDIRSTGNIFNTYGNSNSVFLRTNDGVNRFVLDSSGNATFAGTINSGAITSTGLTVSTSAGAVINLTDSGSHTWKLTTDNQDNFFRVKDGTSSTYLKVGTADSEFATNLNLTSGHSFKINGTTRINNVGDIIGTSYYIGSTNIIDTSRNLTNIGTINSGEITNSGLYVNKGQVWSATTQGTGTGSIHIDPNSNTDHAGGSITFGASDHSNGTLADAGIYIRSDGSYGTRMYLSTTDSYASGSKTAMSLDSVGNVDITRGVLKMGSTTIIDSSRNVKNVTLSAGTTGARFQATAWHMDTNNQKRLYFAAGDTNYYEAGGSGGGHHFRANGDTTRLTISPSGGINLFSSGDTQASTGEVINVAGTNILDSSRNLNNIGTISSGAITSSGHIQGAGALKITETGTAQVIMIGNQDSGGINKPAMIMGVNGDIRIGHGSSWSGEGGTLSEKIAISGSDLKITSGGLILNATTVIDSSRNLTNIGTISSGAITAVSLQLNADGTDLINFSANSTANDRGIAFNNRSALTADYNDGWLRLNQNNEFSNGVYTPGSLRVDSAITSYSDITTSGVLTLSSVVSDTINFSGTTNSDSRGISFDGRAAVTADSADGWLRFNNASEFTNGMFSPGGAWLNGFVRSSQFQISTTTVIDSSRNLTNIGGISATGAGTTPFTFTGTSSALVHKIGSATQTEYSSTLWETNDGLGQIWKTGSSYTAWGGADALNIYNSNGSIAFHPSATANVLKLTSTGATVTGTISSGPIHILGATGGDKLAYASHFEAVGANIQLTLERTSSGWGGIGASGNNAFMVYSSDIGLRFGVTQGGSLLANGGTEFLTAARQIQNVTFADALYTDEYGKSLVGNFGQFHSHEAYNTGFNTSVDMWGWNYVKSATNAPNSNSSQWYRNRVSLGDQYGYNYDSNDYWLEMAYPRYTHSSAGHMWIRSCEGGGVGGWSQVGSNIIGNFVATGNVTAYSDERLKENIQTLDSKKALQMRGVSFIKDGVEGSGVIAQEIEEIAPELVMTADDEMGTKSVAYGNLVGYLIETVKEQQKEIEYMKSEIKHLQENNNGD